MGYGTQSKTKKMRINATSGQAEDVTRITSKLLADLPIHDITITDPPIEDVIEQAFNQ
jgi:ABC-type uncharacterized transport system ATPase subunit